MEDTMVAKPKTNTNTSVNDDQNASVFFPNGKGSGKQDDQQSSGAGGKPYGAKEQEPTMGVNSDEEAKIMAEIKSTSEKLDAQALAELQKHVQEAKLRAPEITLPPDVEDSGVISPQKEADKVVENGPSITISATEKAYKTGLHMKVAGTVNKGVVSGISSMVALALWIKRMISIAHKHTMKVVFRKEANKGY